MFYDPTRLAGVPVYGLLRAAAQGHAGMDQRWVRAIVDRGDAALDDLLRFASEPHAEDRVDLEEDLTLLFRHFRTPKALPFYMDSIRRAPEEADDELVHAVGELGAAAVEPLLALYEELGEEQGSDVAFLLATLGVRDPRILAMLLERLEYDAGDGAFCLGLYGDPASRPALDEMLAGIDPDDADLRREIVYAIEQLGPPRPAGEDETFDILKFYPEKESPWMEALSEDERLEMLASSAAEYREQAAASFLNKSLSPEVRDRLFLLAKNDPEAVVRARAWEALMDAIGEPGIRDAMLAALADEREAIEARCGALVGLAQASDNPEVRGRIMEFYARPESRAKALEAMWRSLDPSFAEFFPKHLDDADLDVRRQAVWGAGYFGLGSEAGRLRKLFEDEDLRADALFAYALAAPAEISRGRMRGLFRKIEEAAGGLTESESELVQMALDERLALLGLRPVFSGDEAEENEKQESDPESWADVGRNDPCPCGSGKKFKKCHGA